MKLVSALLFLVLAFNLPSIEAQLPDGSWAPIWEVTDLNGNDHALEDYLDNGQHVIIDFAATWCFHCYNFHQSGTLESLYEDFGPDGSDELMVFMFEGDEDTNDACLYGDINNCSGATQGNYVFGTEYPIANLEGSELDIVGDYNISFWPTIYLINADHQTVWEVGQASLGTWEDWITESFTLDVDFFEVIPGPCEFGEISVIASGGYGNLSYNWSNGESGQTVLVESGYYDLTIEDDLGYFIVLDDIEIVNEQLPFQIDDVEIIDVECHGDDSGSIFIDIDSNDDLDYIWSNGDDDNFNANLESGTYYLTVVNNDNGCDIELEYEVEEAEEITIDFDASHTSCGEHNGSIEIFADGGVGDLYYDFGDGFITDNNIHYLAPGTYEVVVEDENECQSFITIEIEASTMLTTELQIGMELSCAATETLVEASVNSSNEMIYTWSNDLGEIIQSGELATITINQAGNYSLQVVDENEGCESNTTFEIFSNYEVPEFMVEGLQDLDCTSTSIEINVSLEDTASIYLATWSYTDQTGTLIEWQGDVFEINEPGTYGVSVVNTVNGCSAEQTFGITYIDNFPVATFDFLLETEVLNVTSTSFGDDLSEEWTINGEIVEPDENGNIFFEENGIYEVCLSVSNECGVDNTCMTVEVTDIISGSNDIILGSMHLFLAHDQLIINNTYTPLKNAAIQLLDFDGRLIHAVTLDLFLGENSVNVPYLNTGLYLINVHTEFGELNHKVFITE